MIVKDLVLAPDPEGADRTTIDHNDPPLEADPRGHAAYGVELSLGQLMVGPTSTLVITVRQRRLSSGRWAFEVLDEKGGLIARREPGR